MKNIVKAYELEHTYYNKYLFRWIDEDEGTCFSDIFAGFQNEKRRISSDCVVSGPNFVITDLPSVLILIIADQIWNDSLCCSNKYNWYLCRFI